MLAGVALLARGAGLGADSPDEILVALGPSALPSAVAFGPDGRIYVADAGQHRIHVAEGGRLSSFGTRGSGRGQLLAPQGIAVDSTGRVYVSDTGNDRIQVFDRKNALRAVWDRHGLRGPLGIAVSDTRVYVTDSGNARVVVLDHDGRLSGEIKGPDDEPFLSTTDVAIDASANLYVLDGAAHAVSRFDSRGAPSARWPLAGAGRLGGGVGIEAVAGRVYVCDRYNQRLQVLDDRGAVRALVTRPADQEPLAEPTAVALSPSGEQLVVCESGAARCRAFAPGRIEPDPASPTASEVAREGPLRGTLVESRLMLAFVSADRHEVLVYDKAQTPPRLVSVVGGYGRAPGRLIEPAGAILEPETGRLVVSDAANRRLQVFKLSIWEVGDRLMRQYSFVNPAPSLFVKAVPSRAVWKALRPADGWHPGPLCRHPSGRIFTADSVSGTVTELSADLRAVRSWGGCGSAPRFKPAAIAANPASGELLVVDGVSASVLRFTTSGECRGRIGGDLRAPVSAVADREGFVYVSDPGNDTVSRFNAAGVLVKRFGGRGDGDGQFRGVGALTWSEAGLSVVDAGHRRVQRFSNTGQFLAALPLVLTAER
jgi:DNA-binding beta-propeller fold protein YncE